jgi:CO/xanthine dehydrogenase FAD-binding subunit
MSTNGSTIKSVSSLDEALELYNADPGGCTILAGGTDLMVLQAEGMLKEQRFINIWNLDELRGITDTEDGICIGALSSSRYLLEHPVIRARFPMLAEAASLVGAAAVQNMSTIAGNIINASPAADLPPVLLAYEAILEFRSIRGRRLVNLSDFYLAYKTMDIEPDEILVSIRIAYPKTEMVSYYRKVGTRAAISISKVSFAGAGKINDNGSISCRLAFGAVAPVVKRLVETEKLLASNIYCDTLSFEAVECLTREISPIDDIRSTAIYRCSVAKKLLKVFLRKVSQSKKGVH